MGDRLTQLQDAVDQLAQQFVATFYYVERHHDLEVLGPKDKIQDIPKQQEPEGDKLQQTLPRVSQIK
jgi:mediator of RNA polymerase II transcription subunit 21